MAKLSKRPRRPMSRNQREGRYAGFCGRHVHSKWPTPYRAPFAISAFSVLKTRADQHCYQSYLYANAIIGDAVCW